MKTIFNIGLLLLCMLLLSFQYASAQFVVSSQSPAPNSTEAAASDPITITFNQNVSQSSLNGGIFVYGSVSGSIEGNISTSSNTAVFTPSNPFSEGEQVFISVTENVQSSGGEPLSQPFYWSYRVQPFVGSYEFSQPQIYTLREGSEPSGIYAVDLSNNRAPDIVVVNSNNTLVTILENRTQISDDFSIVSEIETGIEVQSNEIIEPGLAFATTSLPANSGITAADLNNNGFTDVIISATLSNQLIILRNQDGDPSNMELQFIDTGERPVDVLSGDFNGNGYMDLAVASLGSDRVFIHYNNGAGSFGNPQSHSVGLAPTAISAEDINGNGLLDIIVAISGENRVEALLNQGNSNFNNNILMDNLSFNPSFMVTGNFVRENNNDYPDIILGSSDERIFSIFENTGGSYSFAASRTTGNSSRPLAGAAADLDSDGALDLLTTHFGSNDLIINEFTSSTLFGSQITVDNNVSGPLGITSADLNLGGSMDIAVLSSTNNQVRIYFNLFESEVCEDITAGLTFPQVVNFGAVEVGQTSTRQFQIVNNSEVSFDVTLEIASGNNFNLETTSEFDLAIGSQRNITVSFTPDDIDEFSDELIMRVNSVCGVQTFRIDLLGETGEPLPDLVATAINSISFETEYLLGTSYEFEGVFTLEGDVVVDDPFNVSFLVNGEVEEVIRVDETIQPGQTRAYSFSFSFSQPGANTITFFVDSDDEIEEMDETNNEISINITVSEGGVLVSPNPFTPNNDGFNDSVQFNLTQLANVTNPNIQIFSFNGRLVRTLRGEDFGGSFIEWDGTDENGNVLQPGVYLYVVEDNNNMVIRGAVTLAL
ncbi:MAG: VCBS repeat-containing protein [Balneolaceae bacterium]|nr:VCBS repeat-containing protein [Balneolaceae bacterium]